MILRDKTVPSILEIIAACAVRLACGQVVKVDPPLGFEDALLAACNSGSFFAEVQGAERGFVTSIGRFVSRRDAVDIAVKAGQRKRLTILEEQLACEDIW